MLSDWDIEQYATRTMQKEGFEAGAKWARDALIKEMKHIEVMDLRGVIDEYPKRGVYPYCPKCEQYIDARFTIHRKIKLK